MQQQISVQRRGLMMVLSSPSGAGKSTISRNLMEMDSNLKMSISYTTRPMRPGEVNGHDYHFVGEGAFKAMVECEAFLEHAKVFDYYYGTPKADVFNDLKNGIDVLFDIDWQGTQQLEQAASSDLVTVFVLPPSWKELERRLRIRAQDSLEVVQYRMSKANDEISHWAEYRYIIINEDFDTAVQQTYHILQAERLKRQRRTGLIKFIDEMLQS
jgi:guanylate kinase